VLKLRIISRRNSFACGKPEFSGTIFTIIMVASWRTLYVVAPGSCPAYPPLPGRQKNLATPLVGTELRKWICGKVLLPGKNSSRLLNKEISVLVGCQSRSQGNMPWRYETNGCGWFTVGRILVTQRQAFNHTTTPWCEVPCARAQAAHCLYVGFVVGKVTFGLDSHRALSVLPCQHHPQNGPY
jgi:hypothetical protein